MTETNEQPTRLIGDIVLGARHRRELGDIGALAKSIAEVGLLHPIVITADNQLIAGQRRLEAYKRLGRAEIPVRVISLTDIVRGEFAENINRKDFLPTEMVAIAKALEPEQERAAKERQGMRTDIKETFLNVERGQTRDKVGAFAGVSGRTIEKAEAVVEAAEREPEKYQPLVEKMDRTGKVNGAFKILKRMKQAEDISKEPPPLPVGPFRVIVADPPWRYDNRANDLTHLISNPYPDMAIEQIKAMPVSEMATDDSVLWLWTTNAHMRQAFEVLDAWGFEYKTLLTWVKDKMGTGDWLRGQTEHCLLAVKGKPLVMLSNQSTVLYGPVREHSRKPEEFYRMVEALCPGSKVELFAREQREGWKSHGNDVTTAA